MNTPSNPTRCLLDKNALRYAVTGLRDRHKRQLSPLEIGSLSFWRVAQERDILTFISHSSFNLLQPMKYKEIQFFLNTVKVLLPTRYHTRWTRRIRETTGLTGEDAAIIALASFGSDSQGSILGVHQLFTYDHKMINGYLNHLPVLQRRLQAMTVQLPAPFNQATLPRLISPDEILREWTT